MSIRLPIPKGINAIPVQAIPDTWDKQWFSTFIRTWLANGDTRNAIAGSGILITGQSNVPATLSVTAELMELFEQEYLVSAASPLLTNSRLIVGQSGVLTTSAAPAGDFTIGIAANGVGADQLRKSAALSVMGNPTNASAEVADIVASADGQILQRTANTVNWGLKNPYSLQAPLTGATIVIPDNVDSLLLNPAGTIAALSVATPVNPTDSQIIRISTLQTVTTLTLSASSGQTLGSAFATTLTAGPGISYQYAASITMWVRLT